MLEKYKEKRDFDKTPEPAPGDPGDDQGPLTFVIQKHAATRLHYDFRLEFDGVLKSWPVPKGPSLNPADKRLAIMVEDHPLDYASFEGVIPKGEYGGGQVIVWDAGTYSPDEGGGLSFGNRQEADRRMQEDLKKGKISVFLRGEKLKGSWTLVKTSRGAENEWLLIKHQDRFADPDRDILEEDASVISGLTIEDLKAGRLPGRTRAAKALRPSDLTGAVKAPMPKSIDPMHAALTEKPFSAPGWLFEPKLDGVRAIAFKDGGVRLCSRRGLDSTRQYPGIAEEVSEQPSRQLVLDGEIVAHDENGVPSFQRIQQRLGLQRDSDIRKAESTIPVTYYVFDILYADGYDLRPAPLSERRRLLEQVLVPMEHIVLVEPIEGDGVEVFEAVKAVGLEGLIAKQENSPYEQGKRTGRWRKIKATHQQEFLVGGFSQGEGGRADTFGSLLLGFYEDGKDKLTYVGNVGTGFNDKTLKSLRERLDSIRADEQPFEGPMTRSRVMFGRHREGPITWVRPELVAEVRFTHWTDDGHLRAPSFLGLRGDKSPEDVLREESLPPPVISGSMDEPPEVNSDEVASVLEQLETEKDKALLKVFGNTISLTNLDKPLWPALEDRRALTKRDLLKYFARVSPYLLPHMKDRPITLTRYPNGITEQHFYQKHWESKLPPFVDTVNIYSGHNDADGEYILCNNLPTLLWLGQLADIELHTWYSRINAAPDGAHFPETYAGSEERIDASRLNYPDFMVFDLDPYIYSGKEKKGAEPELNRKAYLKTCEVALWVKDVLDSLSLSSFVKTTGKTGLHIYVPILRQFDYDAVRSACETIGRFVMQAHPKDVTMEWSVPKRAGKVFYDHNQNVRGKTLASLYSPRPSPEASVSMPIRWDELKDTYPTDFTILTAMDRLEKTGDLWRDILDHKHDLAALLGSLEEE